MTNKFLEQPWHKRRIVTKHLPLRDEFDPIFDGKDAVCYVVDSGIANEHEEFADSTIELLYSVKEGDFSDVTNHGTKIVSLINGKVSGVSPNATVKLLKIVEDDKKAQIDSILAAFDAILKDHETTKDQAKVVCLPWAIPQHDKVDVKVKELANNNLVIVCASGQHGKAIDEFSPARLSEVITVGATDSYDRAIEVDHPWVQNAKGFVNFGEALDIFAPGVGITVADAESMEYTDTVGTSLSAAIVAGAVCHILQTVSNAYDVRATLMENALKSLVYRDESIYTDKSNAMVHIECKYYKEVWNIAHGLLMSFSDKDDQFTVDIDVDNSVVSIDSPEYAHIPHFVEVKGKQLVISPSKVEMEGSYQFVLTAITDDGYEHSRHFSLEAHHDAESELKDKEFYYEVNEDGKGEYVNYLEFQAGIQIK